MSKALKTIAIVAGVVALTFAIPGMGGVLAGAIGTSMSVGTAATISAIASAVCPLSMSASKALLKPPGLGGLAL